RKKNGNESNPQRWRRPAAAPCFRRFRRYSFKQVADVALMLYARTPIKTERWKDVEDRDRWFFGLVQTAFGWLDLVRENYETVIALSRGVDASKSRDERKAEKRNVELEGLPDPVPYETAAKRIMQDWHNRAPARFEELVNFASPFLKRTLGVTPATLLKRWRKKGIPLKIVHQLHSAQELRRKKRKRKARLP